MNHESRTRRRRAKGRPSPTKVHESGSDEIVDELRRCLAVASGAILA